jgi:serine/threonine-protein kinase
VVVVEKAMEKNPTDRYQTAAELAADLNRFARGEPIHARPPSPSEKFRRWSFRHRGRLAMVTAASVLLSVISWLSGGQPIRHSPGSGKRTPWPSNG